MFWYEGSVHDKRNGPNWVEGFVKMRGQKDLKPMKNRGHLDRRKLMPNTEKTLNIIHFGKKLGQH